jgi:hypothetical protein
MIYHASMQSAICFVLLACVLITLGRAQIRRSRRTGMPRRRMKLAGWALVALGFVSMILGVLFW